MLIYPVVQLFSLIHTFLLDVTLHTVLDRKVLSGYTFNYSRLNTGSDKKTSGSTAMAVNEDISSVSSRTGLGQDDNIDIAV